MELANTGWVDIVKHNIKTKMKEHIINNTLEVEKTFQARGPNIRVTRTQLEKESYSFNLKA